MRFLHYFYEKNGVFMIKSSIFAPLIYRIYGLE